MTQVTVTPRQVAAADQTPVRPLWQDLLSDVLPGAEGGNTGQGSDSAKLEPPAVNNAGPAEPDRANERARAPEDAPAAGNPLIQIAVDTFTPSAVIA